MFGNVMNNKQIAAAQKARAIRISPFSPNKLKSVHYPLSAGKIFHRSAEGPDGAYGLELKKDFATAPKRYVFEPGEYAIVEIKEHIAMEESFVGHFIPSSQMVTKGLGLTAGRIEAPFGEFNDDIQMVRFGLKNLTDMTTVLRSDDVLAYVYFVDIRGLDNATAALSKEERERFEAWTKRFLRASDDGPNYEQ